jgi:cob(I)alamin adenosyltransferase
MAEATAQYGTVEELRALAELALRLGELLPRERRAQLVDLVHRLLAVGGALLGEEQQQQLVELARQLLAVARALLDLLEERLERIEHPVGPSSAR